LLSKHDKSRDVIVECISRHAAPSGEWFLSWNANRIQRQFDLTAVQSHPRSSILVSMESP